MVPLFRFLNFFFNLNLNFISLKVVVNNVPNLGDPEERHKINSMVHAFANTRHTIGDDSVQFWLNEMEWYYNDPKHGIIGEGYNLSSVNSEEIFYGLAKVLIFV